MPDASLPILAGRVLPPEEWATQLRGTPLDGMPLTPGASLVVVVEEDTLVVSHAVILSATHLDALWTAESHRGHAGTARALVSALTAVLQHYHIPEVLALSQTPETDALYAHAGGKRLPGTLWVIPVEGK